MNLAQEKYIDRCMKEETTRENFDRYERAVHYHWAWKFYQITPAISAMGGWANFRSWIKNHAASYFNTCQLQKEEIAQLKTLCRSLIESNESCIETNRDARSNVYFNGADELAKNSLYIELLNN